MPTKPRPFVEHCWTLVGRRQGLFWYARRMRRREGEPHQVACDAQWTLEREEQRGDAVGFYHTHPPGATALSSRDIRTMRAWVSAFGKPLLCLIECDRQLAAYRFEDDESSGERLPASERFPRGVVVVLDHQQGGSNDT